MNQGKTLEKVAVELEFPHESELAYPSSERTTRALPPGIRNVKLLGQILNKLRGSGKLVVEFELPRTIKSGLEAGKYLRKGGVIVSATSRPQVVTWLKEARVARVGKVVSVLTVLVDIWSEYVLNEKLKQIQSQLNRIEELVKAQYYSTFLDAHGSLKAAIVAKNPEYQAYLFRESRSLFQTARNKTRILINERVKKIDEQFRRFDESWFDNRKEIKAIYTQLQEIAQHAEWAIHCYRAESRILERLLEFPLASQISTEGMNFQLDVLQYLTFFTEGQISYPDLELLSNANLNPQGAGNQGAIHKRVKIFDPTDLLFPGPASAGAWIFYPTSLLFPAVAYRDNPTMTLPDWLYEEYRPLHEGILAIENSLPIGVFELSE